MSLCVFIIILIAYRLESVRLSRIRQGIRLRIGVTGTRGKSSVTRLIAAALRGSGLRVVAKSTGSRPMLIRADGSEFAVERVGSPSIIEQKKLLSLAQTEGAEAFVAEIMSIGPDNQAIESARILNVNLCVVTNVRVDHSEEQGSTRSEVAACLSTSVPQEGLLVCLEGEDLPELREACAKRGSTLRLAPCRLPEELRKAVPELSYSEFEENLSLALDVCVSLGLDAKAALTSMSTVVPDLGALRSWEWADEASGAAIRFVNAFAANDIESSLKVVDRSLPATADEATADDRKTVVGILNLRSDRAERSRQWIDAIISGQPERISMLYVVGAHSRIVARRSRGRVPLCVAADARHPAMLFSRILHDHPGSVDIIGLGNIAGPGVAIVEYCAEKGLAQAMTSPERLTHES